MIFHGGGGGGVGPLDPRMRMIDPLASSVKPIRKTGFLMQWFIFHCSATSDTSKHDEVHDSGYFIWFYIEHTGTLNGISMH